MGEFNYRPVDFYALSIPGYALHGIVDMSLDALKTKDFHPDMITDVRFYPNTVKMFFKDGTVTTATAQGGDEFDPEIGMMVGIMKYIYGGSAYNNTFRHWIKNDEKREKMKEKAIADEAERKEIEKRQAAKRARYKAKRREKRIEEQKEAYVRAMKEMQQCCKNFEQ